MVVSVPDSRTVESLANCLYTICSDIHPDWVGDKYVQTTLTLCHYNCESHVSEARLHIQCIMKTWVVDNALWTNED